MDAFDAISKEKVVEKKKGSSVPIVGTTSADKQLIDSYATVKVEFKDAQERLGEIETQLKTRGKELLASHIMKEKFTKSIVMEGTTNSIRVTQSDRFTVLGKELELKEILGPKYDLCFDKEQVVTVKPEVLTSENLRKEFLNKFSKEEIERYFSSTTVIKTKKGFDETLYELSSKEKDKLRPFVTQAAPGITVL